MCVLRASSVEMLFEFCRESDGRCHSSRALREAPRRAAELLNWTRLPANTAYMANSAFILLFLSLPCRFDRPCAVAVCDQRCRILDSNFATACTLPSARHPPCYWYCSTRKAAGGTGMHARSLANCHWERELHWTTGATFFYEKSCSQMMSSTACVTACHQEHGAGYE